MATDSTENLSLETFESRFYCFGHHSYMVSHPYISVGLITDLYILIFEVEVSLGLHNAIMVIYTSIYCLSSPFYLLCKLVFHSFEVVCGYATFCPNPSSLFYLFKHMYLGFS